jgi:hypothetical protein
MNKRLFFALILGLALLAAWLLPLWSQAQAAQVSSRRLVSVLQSEQRTATTTSDDITNFGETINVKGGYITLDVTAVLTTPLITLSVQLKDPASGQYETLMSATSGVTTTGTHTYLIYPGAGEAGADVTQVAGYVLPPTWRVKVDHADTDPITYSVGAMLVE